MVSTTTAGGFGSSRGGDVTGVFDSFDGSSLLKSHTPALSNQLVTLFMTLAAMVVAPLPRLRRRLPAADGDVDYRRTAQSLA